MKYEMMERIYQMFETTKKNHFLKDGFQIPMIKSITTFSGKYLEK